MNRLLRLAFLFFLSVAASVPAVGQLKSRSDQLMESYRESRKEGLTVLNRRYLSQFDELIKQAVQAGEIDEAKAIQEYRKKLEDEIEQLKKDAVVVDVNNKNFLVGKQISFIHPKDTSKPVLFQFRENGQAFWVGVNGVPVERLWKPAEGEGPITIWWESRPEFSLHEIKVSEDGKTAELLDTYMDRKYEGTIEEIAE